MANIIGAITTSHVPAIGNAISKGLQEEPYWRPFFAGYETARQWLRNARPDVVVVIYNDHGLNFFLDKIPTFAIGAAAEYTNADEGWGLDTWPAIAGNPELSWHMAESLVAEEFDMTTCQEMLLDHAFMVPMSLMWPEVEQWPVQAVPISVNTVQHPCPSPARCYKLGQAVGRAIEAYEEDLNVVVIGTGGMSHQLGGERAGLINKRFDLEFMHRLVHDPDALARMSLTKLIEEAGTEGAELMLWLAARGALGRRAAEFHRHYHIPISNTAAGLMVLERAA